MELDARSCYRALSSRDARFDGRFFTAVLSTGVYCRPVCPARTPRFENVRFFPCAAAAEHAGFRACRRCRPESSPGTPAWTGTSATVARALRLISEGAMDDTGIEPLAASLGIGSRHLRRLFAEELGATPVAIAQVRRLHFARRLLSESSLHVADVAFAAGFRSVRRFNEAFRERFGDAPTRVRRAPAPASRLAGPVEIRVAYRPPFDAAGILEFLRRRAIPGVEFVSGGAYFRTFWENGRARRLEVRPAAREHALLVRVSPPDGNLLAVAERVRRLFDCDADPLRIAEHLEVDPMLAPHVRRARGRRVPGAFDPFETAVRAILGQQISVPAASTLAGRVAAAYGRRLDEPFAGLTHVFPTPERLSRARLTDAGIPGARAEAIRAFARAVESGRIEFRTPAKLDDTIDRLVSLPGIGSWTANYVAMRSFGEPDAFPAGDLVVRRALSPTSRTLSERDVLQRAEMWRPWRAYATLHLWGSASSGKRKEKRS